MPAAMPHDKWGNSIQTLAPVARAGTTIGGTANRVTLPTGYAVFRLSATSDCYVLFGTSGVTATADPAASDLFPAGVEVLAAPPGATHISVIQVSAGGTFQVSALS